jgi:hypothetical protein
MIIIYGTHRFGLKKTGVRKDFCNACQRECVAELYESFDCGHFFYIPILPLGRKRRWICTLCHKDPRARYKTSKTIRFLALIIFPFIAFPFLFLGVRSLIEDSDGAWAALVIGAILLIPWIGMLHTLIKPKQGPDEDERRRGVVPLSQEECFYCHGPVTNSTHPECHSCGITIYGE